MITEWPEFKYPKLEIMKRLMTSPVVFDGRNIYDRNEMKKSGFSYYCIGVDTGK
jgi:UDPglucose 6-dehydrogenase